MNIELKAPVERVWEALTDYRKFNEWFVVKLEGPFVAGKTTRGRMICEGHENVKFEVMVQKLDKEKLFSYCRHPYSIDAKVDYSKERPTLVEFKLEKRPGGTALTVSEVGFTSIPERRREEAHRMHVEGWGMQLKNIEKHLKEH